MLKSFQEIMESTIAKKAASLTLFVQFLDKIILSNISAYFKFIGLNQQQKKTPHQSK